MSEIEARKEISGDFLLANKKLSFESDAEKSKARSDIQWLNYQPLSADMGNKKLVAQNFIRQTEEEAAQQIQEQAALYEEFIEAPYIFASKGNIDDIKKCISQQEKAMDVITDVCVLKLAVGKFPPGDFDTLAQIIADVEAHTNQEGSQNEN